MSRERNWTIATMARNESVSLPMWWRYYAQFFDAEDIYILNQETTDGSPSGPGFARVAVT